MSYLANKLAFFVYMGMEEPKNSLEVYQFSFQLVFEMFLGILSNIVIAVLLNMQWECFIFMSIFFSLRSFAGGFHLNTFSQCFVFSTALTCGVLLSAKYITVSVWLSCIIYLSATAFLACANCADHKNREVTNEESVIFKKRLKHSLTIVSLFFFLLLCLDKQQHIFLVSLSVGVTAMLMLLTYWKDKYEK